MPREYIILYIIDTSDSVERRLIAVHFQNLFEHGVVGQWRTVGINQVRGHGEHPIAISCTLSAKEVPAGQRRTVLGQMCRGVKFVGENYDPRFVVDIGKDGFGFCFRGKVVGWGRGV